ncbi:hypothetical protein [Treponema pedis]|uniref:Uncharacterized protein n=1 Tax=Treponema pedis str. T A4 TaxID=1291379 RepID=S5ZXU4_9SPIR|nr:hypothetical protein [Treponema pedis]AGT42788.1 hypothetical protein TPE_0292 [Treponema pedis str. T A4]QSI03663.1 hypothetical protein DYQ05_01390 [Treponema pedis]
MKKIIGIMFIFSIGLNLLWGIILPDGTDALIDYVDKYDNGSIYRIKLSEDTELTTKAGKFIFKTDKMIEFYENGFIKSGELKNGNTIEFYENGMMKQIELVNNIKLNTKNGSLIFIGDIHSKNKVEFYENGIVKTGWLKDSQIIKTGIGDIKTDGRIHFYENGGISWVEIKPKQINTSIGKIETTKLFFNKKGSLSMCKISPQKITSGKYSGLEFLSSFTIYDEIAFYENGKIKNFSLRSNDWIKTNIGKIKVTKDGGFLEIYENGNLKKAFIQSQVFDTPLGLISLSNINLYESGKFESIKILENTIALPEQYRMYTEINEEGFGQSEMTIPECSAIGFYESGGIKWGRIHHSHSFLIQNNKTNKNEICVEPWFYEDGKPMGSRIAYNSDIPYYIIFSEEGEFLNRAVIDETTGTLRKASQDELQELNLETETYY